MEYMIIDILMENSKDKKFLLGECKWKKDVNAAAVVNDMVRKRSYLPGQYNDFKDETYLVVARSFSKRMDNFQGKRVQCFSLDNLEQLLKST
jgi:hypothetical protein